MGKINQFKSDKNPTNTSIQTKEDNAAQGSINVKSSLIQRSLQEQAKLKTVKNNFSSDSKISMPASVQAKMENSFQTDFSEVNIHEGDSATAMNALAYTQGNDIHFASGQYNPESKSGQQLLGHELTHVVQQRNNSVQPTTQLKGVGINDDKGLEKEADEMGEKAAEGKVIDKQFSAASVSNSNSIQRFEAPGHEAAERVGLTSKRADGKEFSNEEASMSYFGNWMRDMNQAMVPAFAGMIGTDGTFALMRILAIKKFGRELSPDLFGYYIPSEHIDNPAGQVADEDYFSSPPPVSKEAATMDADRYNTQNYQNIGGTAFETKQENLEPKSGNVLGANIYSVDDSGVMAYIRRTNLHVEKRLQLASIKGRTSEGLVHFGAALHAVEDLFAHSNYIEIALNQILKENPPSADGKQGLLPELKGEERNVQTLSPTTNLPDKRPALVTGTFTGLDTLHSIGSEGIKMLRTGLAPAASEEEKKAQQALVSSCLKKMEELKNNKDILKKMTDAYPGSEMVVKNVNVSTLYDYMRVIPSFGLFDAIHNMLVGKINTEVLNPAADKVEEKLLVTRVQDTPVYKDSKSQALETQRKGGNNFTPMQELQAEMTGKPLSAADNLASANKRLDLINNTPSKVQAGASHTQLAKDHTNSIFFGLAFKLAAEADKMLRDKIIAVWGNSPKATDPHMEEARKYRKEQAEKPKPTGFWESKWEGAKNMFEAGPSDNVRMAEARSRQETESLKYGQEVSAHGKKPGQEYDLQELRDDSADRVKAIAETIRGFANAPSETASSLEKLKKKMGNNKIDSKEANAFLDSSIQNSKGLDQKFKQDPSLNLLLDCATEFDAVSNEIRVADTLKKREAVYAKLEAAKAKLIAVMKEIIARKEPSMVLQMSAFASLLVLIDREAAVVAPAYTTSQLNDINNPDPSKALTQSNITLPSLNAVDSLQISAEQKAALKELLNTSRVIIDHPADSAWWKPHVTNFINQHSAQIKEEIKARNAGYANFGGEHKH